MQESHSPPPETHSLPLTPLSCTVSPLGAVLSLHQEGSSQLPKAPVGVGGILMGPSPEAPYPCCPQCPLSPEPGLGFCPAWPPVRPPTENSLGPGPDDLTRVSLSGSRRAASPSMVLQLEPAGLDAAPGRVSSWWVSSNHCRGCAGHIYIILRCIRPFPVESHVLE